MAEIPTVDTVMVVGGLGTKADSATLNGGGATKAAWDAGSPTDFIDTNGGPIATATDAAVGVSGAETTFTLAGAFAGVTDGTLCYVNFDATAETAGYTDGWTYIISHTDDTIVTETLEFGAEGTGTVTVGGAVPTLQEALDHDVNDATSYNRYILTRGETITSTVDVDTNSAGQAYRLTIQGMNATFTATEAAEIDTETYLVNGLVRIANAIINTKWVDINFNGGGKDSTRAVNCVSFVTGTSEPHFWVNCEFFGASADGFANMAEYSHLSNCNFYLNGASGYYAEFTPHSTTMIGCTSHDNDTYGFHFWSGNNVKCIKCIAYDNGKDESVGHGFFAKGTANWSAFVECTAYGNYGDGFAIETLALLCQVENCTSVGNGGYGFNLNAGKQYNIQYFGYNHASGNTGNGSTTTHYNGGVDSTFADFKDGNNIAGTQAASAIFTNVTDGSEDFTPVTGSDLIDNGLDAMSAGMQDIGAIQAASGGGGRPEIRGSNL